MNVFKRYELGRISILLYFLLHISHVLGVSQYCHSLGKDDSFCVALLLPKATVENNAGDIYLRITVPWRDRGWTAIGMGSNRMEGSLMFLLHKGEGGQDVMLSMRVGTANVQPRAYYNTRAQIYRNETQNGQLSAYIRCRDCRTWSGGYFSVGASSSPWIWSRNYDDKLETNDLNAGITFHNRYGFFNMDNVQAVEKNTTTEDAGIDDIAIGETSGGTMAARPQTLRQKLLMFHGVIMSVAFLIMYPLGGAIVRFLWQMTGLETVMVHYSIQLITTVFVLGAFGVATYASASAHNSFRYHHQYYGVFIIAGILLQIPVGIIHHHLYQNRGRPTFWTNFHIFLGRIIIPLGIINGGLGLSIYDQNDPPTALIILYSIVAALVGIGYIAAWLWDRRWRENWRRRVMTDDTKRQTREDFGDVQLQNMGDTWVRREVTDDDGNEETHRLVDSSR